MLDMYVVSGKFLYMHIFGQILSFLLNIIQFCMFLCGTDIMKGVYYALVLTVRKPRKFSKQVRNKTTVDAPWVYQLEYQVTEPIYLYYDKHCIYFGEIYTVFLLLSDIYTSIISRTFHSIFAIFSSCARILHIFYLPLQYIIKYQ